MAVSEERRLVSVLFADLVGFTDRADSSDPEIVRDIQRDYFGAVAEIVERFGGVVEKYIGDAAMAIFGVPQAHDDDAERALHAALQIRQTVTSLGHDLEIRIGVNSGEVVGGEGAGPQAGEYTVTGNVVNVAARLQQAAPPNEIYVGDPTRRLAAKAFEFSALGSVALRGKREPLEVWRLLSVLPERPRVRGSETPLVGRRRELAALDAALDEAEAGQGLLVAVAGEAGIGKSRLALELRTRAMARAFGSTWASARPYSQAFPYHVATSLIRDLLRATDAPSAASLSALGVDAPADTISRWATVLRDVLGASQPDDAATLAELTPSGWQHLLVQATVALLTARAEARPQLMVLDDLQWTDVSSVAVIDGLVDAAPNLPVLIVALFRPGWAHQWAGKSFYQQLNLGGLREPEAAELVQRVAGAATVTPERAAQVLRRAGGNPFFLEELLHADATLASGSAGLPQTVHEVLQARIDGLPGAARRLLQLAAVVGMEFSEEVLAVVEPGIRVEHEIQTLQREDLVLPQPTAPDGRRFVFRHPLIHEVAYRSLLLARRRELHGKIGRWLEEHGGDEALPVIAAHFRDSDERERATASVRRAAERAASLNALPEAVRWYREAAELVADEPIRRAQMLERAAIAQSQLLGDPSDAIELIDEAGRLYAAAGDERHALDCRRWLGRFYWMDGRGAKAEVEIAAAVDGLERLPPSPELALAYSYRSQIRMLVPDFEAGAAWAHKAIAMAEQTGSTEALVHALNNLGVSSLGLGDAAGLDHLRRSLALALEHNLTDDALRAYTNLSAEGSEIALFENEEIEELYREMLAYDDRVAPGRAYVPWHMAGQAKLWVANGRWDDAEHQLRSLSGLEGANPYLRLKITTVLSLLETFRGQHHDAAQRLRPLVDNALRIGDLQAYGPMLTALVHAEALLGNGEAAADAAALVIERRGNAPEADITSWSLFNMTDAADWLLTTAPGASAERITGDLLALSHTAAADAMRGGTPAQIRARQALFGAASEQLLALAARQRMEMPIPVAHAALPDRTRAIDDLRALHRPFDAARVELWLAEEASANGARRAQRAASARAVFAELGAMPYLDRVGGLTRA